MKANADKLLTKLKELAPTFGVDVFGIANITSVKDFLSNEVKDLIKQFPKAISIGVRLSDAVVDQLSIQDNAVIMETYQAHCYLGAASLVQTAAFRISKLLQDAEYRAYPLYTGLVNGKPALSQKIPAYLSGLGWIGKSCLLVTPEFGPRVWLSSVLTDAPLPHDSTLPSRCGECERCKDICPSKAIKGVSFNPSEPLDMRFDPNLCKEYCQKQRDLLGIQMGRSCCGLCIYICPHGNKGSNRSPSVISDQPKSKEQEREVRFSYSCSRSLLLA